MDGDRPGKRLTLGRIGGLYGVKGWVKVHSYTRPAADILGYRNWWVGEGDAARVMAVAEGREHGAGLVARFEGVDGREQARALVGQRIAVERSQLPPLAPGEYYWCDLEGLEVVNRAGETLGRVDHLIETGANDVLVVRGERERLLPYTAQVVRRVDLDAGVIEVDWDAGY